MNIFKPKRLLLAAFVSSILLFSPTLFAQEISATPSEQVSVITLEKGNWDTFNREQIDKMMARHGKMSPNYDPNNRPYVVFDWDNTSGFLDVQEALLIYQIENLRYKMTPETMDLVVRMNVPKENFNEGSNNLKNQPVNIDLIAQDIVNNYTWIYNNFDQMKGDKPLAEIKNSDQYKEFAAKMRYLYSAIGDSFDVSISYPWVTYHFAGMTEAEVRRLTAENIEWQAKEPIELVTWKSPDIDSKAGPIEITWNNGYRVVPEMQDLYHKLRDAGIDVWVCSASFIDVIKESSSNPMFGYSNPVTNVIAMELERDANGVIQPKWREGYNQTQGAGKTKEINRLIAPKYNNRGPILVAGDSEGDQNMMQDYKDMEVGIIINRLRSPKNDIGKLSIKAVETYEKPDAIYLLQGRDENTGLFIPSQETIKIGTKESKKLRE